MAASSVDFVKGIYADFETGNIPEILGTMDPNIRWDEAAGMPFGGIFNGPEEVLNGVLKNIGVFFDDFKINPVDIFANEDGTKVTMYGHYTAINKATGTSVKANTAHIISIKDGKIFDFFQTSDTFSLLK